VARDRACYDPAPVTLAWFVAFFLVSGFCSLVDQVVWLRLAMAQYGVTTPMVSIVLSVFMGGLALGSWAAGRLSRRLAGSASAPLRLYALAELVIGFSALVVPAGLELGRQLLFRSGEAAWGSLAHHLLAGLCVLLVMLPFCACMGATVPLAMHAIRAALPAAAPRSFSVLYLANVLGATLGTLVSAFVLIELLGFRRTLSVAAALNAVIAVAAFLLARRLTGERVLDVAPSPTLSPSGVAAGAGLALLFTTGLASMGMEVVWVRQFTAHLGSVVYTFAIILGVYLTATFAGAAAYRALRRAGSDTAVVALAGAAGALGLLPLLAADARSTFGDSLGGGALRVLAGIGPFCAALGALTPMLIDRWAGGDAFRAGRAYALNVVGCILGPLVAGFGLLPLVGERWALLALSLPVVAVALLATRSLVSHRGAWASALALAAALPAALLLAFTRDVETRYRNREVRRDYAATVMAVGRGPRRELLVNGVGMSGLNPVPKMMVHLPLAFLEGPRREVLVVCFGMGTSFRSALAWGARTTSVELVPSVPELFSYFHADASELMRSPLASVVIDDGRRFLERSRSRYDAIVVDPPPPPEAAGSSLLYSREFYTLVRARLRPGGILQQWLPGADLATYASFTRALQEAFPHVRAFPSVLGGGLHFLASEQPLPLRSAVDLAREMPEAAARDLVAWGPHETAQAQFEPVLAEEQPLAKLIALAPGVPTLTDDRPVNEYYFLRRLRGPSMRTSTPWRRAHGS
jgi:spermidine synthase